eukprot:TRINITY_DN31691_c0_g1_i7.p2 TRINITY_DN31691_c0_g1~~TRINITY_DN31691_c0_g1_i7.p2  ORF type:complete len:192 (+),score=-8.25 TRINITY_DN31691_c0_g1_i7:491-1066(+)
MKEQIRASDWVKFYINFNFSLRLGKQFYDYLQLYQLSIYNQFDKTTFGYQTCRTHSIVNIQLASNLKLKIQKVFQYYLLKNTTLQTLISQRNLQHTFLVMPIGITNENHLSQEKQEKIDTFWTSFVRNFSKRQENLASAQRSSVQIKYKIDVYNLLYKNKLNKTFISICPHEIKKWSPSPYQKQQHLKIPP